MKRIACAVLLAALCGGCETVVFEAPPVAAQACDPALVGNWLSVGDKPGNAGEVELRIGADCTLLFVEHEHGAPREGEPTQIFTGRDGRIRYAWVGARWADRRMSLTGDSITGGNGDAEPSRYADGDVVVYQYTVSARRLGLRKPDPKEFAHRIIDQRVKGEVRQEKDGGLVVRVTAPVEPRALRDSKLFPRGEMRFTRAPAHD